jgi:Domain of unknown function (DUF5925)/ATPase family associated with various cellular activities (AAA)
VGNRVFRTDHGRVTIPRQRQYVRAAGGDPAGLLRADLVVDDSDTPYDMVDALVLAEFVTGRQPFARTVRLDRVRDGATLLPPHARVLRTAIEKDRDARLAAGDGWTLRAVRWGSGGGEVTVTATSERLLTEIVAAATADAAEPVVEEDDRVTMGFWYRSARRGPYRTTRPIAAQPWDAVRGNYTAAAAASLDALMAVDPADLAGRLLLLYGPPGTGKTSALRTLAYQWRRWCRVDCVLDPEALFSDPSYLMDTTIGTDEADDDGDGGPRWRLLVLEDCDELIRAHAKEATGQALSRLLNLTDGLLGQGRHVLVAITTNEDLARLHPAVVRPGRCLAQVEVGPLSPAEATAWLGTGDAVRAPTTLAALYARRHGHQPAAAEDLPRTGLYL